MALDKYIITWVFVCPSVRPKYLSLSIATAVFVWSSSNLKRRSQIWQRRASSMASNTRTIKCTCASSFAHIRLASYGKIALMSNVLFSKDNPPSCTNLRQKCGNISPPQLECISPLPCKSQDVHILSFLTTVITNILHQILNFSHPH